MFRDVPHTVGYVTNLNADLALRALTSLRAELNRRMRVMEGRAKDLEEMLAKYPDDAPASLVIVVDEFATLVKEIPDFVAGIVDIAQRGRSLGIHLVLATQRPSGSVNDNILANTNLRMSLRMLDTRRVRPRSSTAPRPPTSRCRCRGRGYRPTRPAGAGGVPVRLRQRTAGRGPTSESPTVVEDFEVDGGGSVTEQSARARRRNRTRPAPTSHAVLDAVVAAAAECSFPAVTSAVARDAARARHAWTSCATTPGPRSRADHAGRVIPLGLIDDPEHQDQYPATVDLEEGGGLLVFGSGGSGERRPCCGPSP